MHLRHLRSLITPQMAWCSTAEFIIRPGCLATRRCRSITDPRVARSTAWTVSSTGKRTQAMALTGSYQARSTFHPAGSYRALPTQTSRRRNTSTQARSSSLMLSSVSRRPMAARATSRLPAEIRVSLGTIHYTRNLGERNRRNLSCGLSISREHHD